MKLIPLVIAFHFAAGLSIATAAEAAERVDVVLVLAADVSRSITSDKFDLQRKGYAAALTSPQVMDAIAAGQNHRVAVAFVEWSGSASQTVVVDWNVIGSREEAGAFAAQVVSAPRAFANRTAIGTALQFAADLVSRCPYAGDRRVIDVSGDGTNNDGIQAAEARDAALKGGITTINGLVILSAPSPSSYLRDHENPPEGLQAYYRQNVIGGMGAFVLVAKSFESFGQSLVAKLVQELS